MLTPYGTVDLLHVRYLPLIRPPECLLLLWSAFIQLRRIWEAVPARESIRVGFAMTRDVRGVVVDRVDCVRQRRFSHERGEIRPECTAPHVNPGPAQQQSRTYFPLYENYQHLTRWQHRSKYSLKKQDMPRINRPNRLLYPLIKSDQPRPLSIRRFVQRVVSSYPGVVLVVLHQGVSSRSTSDRREDVPRRAIPRAGRCGLENLCIPRTRPCVRLCGRYYQRV